MAESAEDPFDWVGATVDGKYQIDALVGRGGFGVVYRAQHLGFDEKVAVKCLKVPQSLPADQQQEFQARFVAEGRLLHQLSRATAGIVQALDVGAAISPNGAWTPFIVLEWLEGQSLDAHFTEQRSSEKAGCTPKEAFYLLDSAARALAVAHDQGIAHCDIKPANLFFAILAGRVTLKVLDFGIAKVVSDSEGFTHAFEANGAALQALTARYAAPEQFSGRLGATGPWTDVFSLALVFVEAVVGTPALGAGDSAQLFVVAASDPEHRPTLRAHGVDPGDAVESVLLRALAVDPRTRYPSAGSFWDALKAAVGATDADAAFVSAGSSATVPASQAADSRATRFNAPALGAPLPSFADEKTSEDEKPTRPVNPQSPSPNEPGPFTLLNSSAQVEGAAKKPRTSGAKRAALVALPLFAMLATAIYVLRPSRHPTGAATHAVIGVAKPEANAASSARDRVAFAGMPLREVAAGIVDPSGAWLNKFGLVARDGAGQSFEDAFQRCQDVGKTLCTESQWQRACVSYPELQTLAAWTSSSEPGGVVVRGPGLCTTRKLVVSSDREPERIGLCCDRAIAMTTSNLQKNVLASTEAVILKVENVLNQRSVDGFLGLVEERVSLGGAARDRTAVKNLLAQSFQNSAELVLVNDVCEIAVEGKKTQKRSRRGKKTLFETTGWTASCRQTRERDHKPTSALSTYRFSALGKLRAIDESEPRAGGD